MMRRISFLLLFLSWLTVPVLAQVATVHVVKRGETVATIAKQYGVSEADIRTVNPNLTTVFAGVKLNIPVKKSVAEGNKVVRQAKTASQRSTGTTTPKAATSAAPKPAPQQNYYAFNSHYLKGQGYIRDKKWKKAIQELNLALAQPAPAKERSHCQQLLAYAEREKNARSERRAAFLSGLSAGLQTLGQGLQDMAQNQQQQSARAPQRAPQQYPQRAPSNVNRQSSSQPAPRTNSPMPGGLDSQHMKEFKEKGKTTVVLWSNQSGKSIRVVERCLVCKGQPKSCFLCGGSGRDYNGGTCLNCLGQGREHCAVCMNRGYNDDTTVYDSNGKLLTLNGKTPQQIQAETDALYARKEAEATGYSKSPNGGHYERAECVECHGRQVCPTCSGGKQVYIESTEKWYACWNCGGSGTCKRCGGAGYSSSVRFVPNEPNSRHQRDPYNFDTNGRQICQHCHGRKVCPTCSGGQKVYNDGINEWVPCWDCGSTGTCKRCGGNGHVLR